MAAPIRDEALPAGRVAGIARQPLMEMRDRQLAALVAGIAHQRGDRLGVRAVRQPAASRR